MNQSASDLPIRSLTQHKISLASKSWQFVLLGLLLLASTLGEVVLAQETVPKRDRTDAALAAAIDTIRAVGPSGQRQVAASRAWRQLAASDASQMVAILAGMQGANRQACNWLRMAIDAIGERTLRQSQELPCPALEKFVLDVNWACPARQVAFQWLTQSDPSASDRLLPTMLDDRCLALRRSAVGRVLDAADRAAARAKSAAEEDATALQADARRGYRQALAASRDLDQVKEIVRALGELEVKIDLVRQLGYLVDWQVIGPFDNTDHRGFDKIYPPEKALDLDGTHAGKAGPVAWQPLPSDDQEGRVDLNRTLGKLKGAVAYVLTNFPSATDRKAELRWSTPNATKLWVNGRQVAAYESYHTVTSSDQYRATVPLQRGMNRILMKVCQDEQTEDWTVDWQFRLRVTDQLGGAIHAP